MAHVPRPIRLHRISPICVYSSTVGEPDGVSFILSAMTPHKNDRHDKMITCVAPCRWSCPLRPRDGDRLINVRTSSLNLLVVLCRRFQALFLVGFGFVRYINEPARECIHSSPSARNP